MTTTAGSDGVTMEGVAVDVDAVIGELRGSLRGAVLAPGDNGYDDARRVWNGAIDRYPAVIARCVDSADVVHCVGVARRHRIEVAIRGGGHQVAGSGVCDDGLVIDCSEMVEVSVDPEARTARVGAGARWGDVDRATQVHGLVTPGGEVSVTGVAGLTLGGGMGFLQRHLGLACDSLRSLEVVTADGMVRTASATEHPDLFRALRGAGRGLGVVTSFEFALHQVGPELALAWVVHVGGDTRELIRGFRDLAVSCPGTVSPELLLWTVPPDPEFPPELHGEPAVMVMGVFAGDPSDAAAALEPFGAIGPPPTLDLGGVVRYVDLQCSVDHLLPEGDRYFFKAHFADDLSPGAIDAIATAFEEQPNERCLIAVRTLGGAIDRVGPEESAYPHRGATFNVSFDAGWVDPSDDDRLIGWARRAWTAFTPHASGGVYVNFSGFDDEDDVEDVDRLGSSERLSEVRAAYDPDGVFAAAAVRP